MNPIPTSNPVRSTVQIQNNIFHVTSFFDEGVALSDILLKIATSSNSWYNTDEGKSHIDANSHWRE